MTDLEVIGGYLDLSQGELRKARVQNLGTAPSSPVEGQIYWNTTTETLEVWDGANWITWYESIVPLNQITAPSGNVLMNSHRVTNVATPTASTDAATKGYVDGISAGLSWKNAVRAATTASGTLASTDSQVTPAF